MTSIDEIRQELEREGRTTRRVLERVPADSMDWRPHEKSMTLGELATHIATLPAGITGIAMMPAFDVSTPVPTGSAASPDELLATFDDSMSRALAALGAMDDAALDQPWQMTAGEQVLLSMTRRQLLRTILLNHTYHHRGQLTVYLRQAGALVPGVYGPSADENPFAGAAGSPG
jgi:uncharacterized damage-inducible protein DinB